MKDSTIYDTLDFNESGSYDFRFKLTDVVDNTINISIFSDGVMTMLATGKDYSIKDALAHENDGWEVELEIKDIISAMFVLEHEVDIILEIEEMIETSK